ncbi:dihydropteroate synthase [Virgibacillus flavescens]|uniref:dihydropteroate synthase n=1 Tax=Virgibacillus flavescens TaxID=1611422 RepID=UPI003D326240
MQTFIKTKSVTYDLSKRTHIMGILNVTPDSFSDGGSFTSIDAAVKQALEMERRGADIIDIGGESTRPNHEAVSAEEEIERIVPAIEAINAVVKVPISIDTYKAETAEAAINAGATIINDVWGAKREPQIADVAAKYGVPIVLMHNRTNKNYVSLIEDMKKDLLESVEIALNAGVKKENIILDPGIGFAKSIQNNYEVMNQLNEFVNIGYPVLLGASRKSFIGRTLDVSPEERDNGTGATTCLAIQRGVQIVRVHDVKRNVELAKMMDAMLSGGN